MKYDNPHGYGPYVVEHRRDVLALREIRLAVEHQRVADASVLLEVRCHIR